METVIRVIPRNGFSLELWFDTGDHRYLMPNPIWTEESLPGCKILTYSSRHS